jgi:predicted acylesterase/phospholipase RssA
MKRFLIVIGILAVLTGLLIGLWHLMHKKPEQETDFGKAEGTAIVITGAAARIAQEAALLEQLYYSGKLDDLAFISGVSSGALNAVMLNAILAGKYSWKQYRNLLFSMNNQSVFFTADKPLPVSTEPLRLLLTRVLHDTIGFYRMKDLPYPTALSTVNLNIKSWADMTYRLSNLRINEESDPDIDLVEVLMASTAFPLAFPAIRITDAPTIPSGRYIDGGSRVDYIPYRAVIEYEKFIQRNVDKLIIVTRKLDTEEGLKKELQNMGITRTDLIDKLNIAIEDLAQHAFLKGLDNLQKEAPLLSGKTYIYMPTIQKDYPLFDFDNLREQYLVTRKWANTHQPIPLDRFLKEGVSVND